MSDWGDAVDSGDGFIKTRAPHEILAERDKQYLEAFMGKGAHGCCMNPEIARMMVEDLRTDVRVREEALQLIKTKVLENQGLGVYTADEWIIKQVDGVEK